MKNLISFTGGLIAIVGSVFTSYLYLDSVHVDLKEQEVEVVRMHQRMLMAESTRYAEVAKYYYELKEDRDLTLAELNRLRAVEKQQERIAKQLMETTHGVN